MAPLVRREGPLSRPTVWVNCAAIPGQPYTHKQRTSKLERTLFMSMTRRTARCKRARPRAAAAERPAADPTAGATTPCSAARADAFNSVCRAR